MGDLNGLIDGSRRNDGSKEIVAIRGGQCREVSRTGREFYREREACGRLIRASRWRQAMNAPAPRFLFGKKINSGARVLRVDSGAVEINCCLGTKASGPTRSIVDFNRLLDLLAA